MRLPRTRGNRLVWGRAENGSERTDQNHLDARADLGQSKDRQYPNNYVMKLGNFTVHWQRRAASRDDFNGKTGSSRLGTDLKASLADAARSSDPVADGISPISQLRCEFRHAVRLAYAVADLSFDSANIFLKLRASRAEMISVIGIVPAGRSCRDLTAEPKRSIRHSKCNIAAKQSDQ